MLRTVKYTYLVKGEKVSGEMKVTRRSGSQRGVIFSETITYSTQKTDKNFYNKISIDTKNKNNFLIRLYQGLVEIHLPEKFNGLEQEEKNSLIDVMITWKFDWISDNLYGLGKLSPKKGRACYTDLLVTLDDYLVYLKQHNNKPPLYPVFEKKSGSFSPYRDSRKGKIGSTSSKRYIRL